MYYEYFENTSVHSRENAHILKKGTIKCDDKMTLVYERWVKASRMYERKNEREL